MYEVIWQPIAEKQLLNTLDYFSERNKSNSYSKKLLKAIQNSLRNLEKHPFLGKPTGFDDVRELIHLDYSFFYVILVNQIHIVHFWDNRRDPNELQMALSELL
jgi:plasmid stabilization system protein ParE